MGLYLLLYGTAAAAFYFLIAKTAVVIHEPAEYQTAPQKIAEIKELFPQANVRKAA